ncbi:MAG: DUF1415 domain-containing protein [Ferruginibacter sp.]|nr:DUF1415 domain-containing protein [Ferruginibacter sp.]
MRIPTDEIVIAQTKRWITDIVAGCGFCPFAAKELQRQAVHYEVLVEAELKLVLEAVMRLAYQLDNDKAIVTSLLIMPGSFQKFQDYLDLVDMAETLLINEKYDGIYQLASFHPEYLFAGTNSNDPSNYTNRSPYPMLHFLREESVTRAVDGYPDIELVPERNIRFAKEKGLLHMQQLLAACMVDGI